jgi:putative transposase
MLPRSVWSCFLVKPDTLLGWHRRLVAGAWTYPQRHTGRPRLDQGVQLLIVRLATEHPRWGYQRIQGELLHLDIGVSATTSIAPLAWSPRRLLGACLARPRGSILERS